MEWQYKGYYNGFITEISDIGCELAFNNVYCWWARAVYGHTTFTLID